MSPANQTAEFCLTQEELDSFIAVLTERTGIIPRASHRDGIKGYIERKIKEKSCSVQGYKNDLLTNESLFNELVNESTVNETYFFREEKQFALLRDRIFPMWRMMRGAAEIKIWSAACSYGEEAYSLALIAKTCGVKALVTASDINSEVLEHCKNGVFLGSSLRQVDGLPFQNLLYPYKRTDGRIEFDSDIRACIQPRLINLSLLGSPMCDVMLPKMQDIIFIRNVFIYFSQELRARILRTIADKCLSDGGILFVSMSEIAQLDSTVMPPSLEKISDGSVFYFHKKTGGKDNG